MICGVNTEDGFATQSVKIFEDPSMNKFFKPKATLPSEVFKLLELKKLLEEYLYSK
jgi:hypothetical protein